MWMLSTIWGLSSKYVVLSVFLVAVGVRGLLLMHVVQDQGAVLQPDSKIYMSLAKGLLQWKTLCYPEKPQQPDVERTPVYPLFLAFIIGVLGGSLITVVVVQVFLDALSCVLLYWLGESVWKGTGGLSAFLGCFNLGMITYAHFILNDSMFVLVFLLCLLLIVQFLKTPKGRLSVLLGVVLGAATMIRPVITYLPLILIPFLAGFLMIKHREGFLAAAGKALTIGIVFVICLSPWMMRNYIHYGRVSLTSQSGEHLLQYIVPFTWQYSRGVPFIEGMKQTSETFKEKAFREKLDMEKASPFEVSDFQVGMALDYLREEPKAAIAKAWFFGMVKNLFAPAIIDFSYLLNIERPHFFYTEGTTTLERAWNFVKGMKGWFGWAVIGSMVLLGLSRIVQVWGLIQLFRRKPWEGLFLVLIIGYFLIVSGPVGYAKYRLPFEPILIILLSLGIRGIFCKEKKTA